MEMNFLNQNPCIPSWPGVFQFHIIFILQSYFLFIRLVRYVLLVGISFSRIVVSFASGCWYVFASFPPSCWYNFLSLFWNLLFCLCCFALCWYLFNHPSFVSNFWVFSSSCTVIFLHVAFSFLFQDIPASFCFILLACFRRFFYLRFQWNFPSGLNFFFVPFCGISMFSQTNFAPA